MFPFFFQLGGFGCLIAAMLLFAILGAVIMLGAVIWPALVAVMLVVILPLALIKKLIALVRPKQEPLSGGVADDVRPTEHMRERPEIIDAEFRDVE